MTPNKRFLRVKDSSLVSWRMKTLRNRNLSQMRVKKMSLLYLSKISKLGVTSTVQLTSKRDYRS